MRSNIKSTRRGVFSKIFWGLLFVTLAVFLIATAVGANWNVCTLCIGAGVILGAVAVKSLLRLEWFGVFIPVALWVTLAQELVRGWLGIEDLRIWAVWLAAVALSIGLGIFIRKRPGCDKGGCTVFAATTKRLRADEVNNLQVTASFGGEKIVIDGGKLPKNATINFDLSFAGVELLVPGTWQIIDNTRKSLGGITEKNSPTAGKREQTLTLNGSLSLSGIEIVYI